MSNFDAPEVKPHEHSPSEDTTRNSKQTNRILLAAMILALPVGLNVLAISNAKRLGDIEDSLDVSGDED